MKTHKLTDIAGIAADMQARRMWRSTTGNLYGSMWGLETGKLPAEYIDRFDKCDYAVYSYETPIAWLEGDDGWYIPSKFYSVSTSKHLAIVRQAITFDVTVIQA